MVERTLGVEVAGEQQIAPGPHHAPIRRDARGASAAILPDHVETLRHEPSLARREALACQPVEHELPRLTTRPHGRGNVAQLEHELHQFIAVDDAFDGGEPPIRRTGS